MPEHQLPYPQAQARVVSGKLRNQLVQVLSASDSMPGFWLCVYHHDAGNGFRRHEALFTTGQLEIVQQEGAASSC